MDPYVVEHVCDRVEDELLMDFTDEGLQKLFSYHQPPNDRVVQAHQAVRDTCLTSAKILVDACPLCSELTIAIRHLSSAMMEANAAIARNHAAFEAEEAT